MSNCKTGKCYTARPRGENARMNEALKAQLDEQKRAERAAVKEPFNLLAWQASCAAVSDETLRVLSLDARPAVAATAAAALAGLIVLSSEDVARLAAS